MFIDKGEATLNELLFEQSDDFIGIYDVAAERFRRVNQAGIQMLGFASEQAFLDDSNWSRSFPNPQRTDEQRVDLIRQISQQGQYDEITELRRLNGETFWGRVKINSFNGQNHLFVVIRILDRERLQRAELELQQSVQRYEAVFTNATIGIIVSNQKGQIVSLNQLAKQLFGYPADTLIGQSIDILVPLGVERHHARLRESFIANPQVRAMGS
jgi:PAS domain S-box-containing protein